VFTVRKDKSPTNVFRGRLRRAVNCKGRYQSIYPPPSSLIPWLLEWLQRNCDVLAVLHRHHHTGSSARPRQVPNDGRSFRSCIFINMYLYSCNQFFNVIHSVGGRGDHHLRHQWTRHWTTATVTDFTLDQFPMLDFCWYSKWLERAVNSTTAQRVGHGRISV